VTALHNLVVDLNVDDGEPLEAPLTEPADGRTLAWIDATFGGWWSSEAAHGSNIIERRGDAPIGFVTIEQRDMRFRWLNAMARERGVGLIGPIGVAPEERGKGIGRRLLRTALQELRERGFQRALITAVSDENLVRWYAGAVGASLAETFDRDALLAPPARTLVLASGNGSNFQAVVDARAAGRLPIEIAGLIVNDGGAYAIERARRAGVTASVVQWERGEEKRRDFDERLLHAARRFEPDLVLLLGWMHLLEDGFIASFPEMLNLHPSFLPLDPRGDTVTMPDGSEIGAFRGAHAVRDALRAGSGWVGATVHRVTRATDRGPVMARFPLRVEAGEDEGALMPRVHEVEHKLVPAAITRWLFERPTAKGEALHDRNRQPAPTR
jgi:phosphoribosylglycinamide formyltransferase-1